MMPYDIATIRITRQCECGRKYGTPFLGHRQYGCPVCSRKEIMIIEGQLKAKRIDISTGHRLTARQTTDE